MHNSKIEILLIEDNLPEANLIKERLSEATKQHFVVHHVQSLADGLCLLVSRNFDCVLIDLGLPDSQGLENALAVRNAAKQTAIVVLTVHDDEDAALKSLQMDIQDYLLKEEINGRLLIRSIRYAIQRKRDVESLRLSEARYRALFRDNPTMIVTLDAELTMLTVNPACACLLGYTINELEGRSVLLLFRKDDHPAVVEQLRTCMQNHDQVYRWQFRKVHKNGGLLWVEETAQAVYDQNGSLNLLVVCQDITERKRIEADREQLLIQFESVLENINEGVVISDLNGNVLKMNQEALALHGYESTEQVRRPLAEYQDTFELFDLEGHLVPFEQWPLIRAIRYERFVDYEVRILRKDTGTSQIMSYSGSPVHSTSGDIILSVITMRNITEQKRAEAEIQRLASFPLMNPNPVLEVDENGLITFCNPAAKQILEDAGYNSDVNPFIPPNMPLILQDLRDNKTGRYFQGIEINGCFFEELIIITPQFQSIRIYTMDITERKQAEEKIKKLSEVLASRAAELEAANVELEAFNYSVAHDLRNPLNVISSYCQVIRELCGGRLDEQCRRYLQETYDGTLRMNRLIEALLEFSRLAHAELNRDRIDLSKLAHDVITMLEMTAPEQQVDFRIAEGLETNGDISLLRMVLDNLLGNARKYTAIREDALIEFGMKEIDGEPVYFVRDNGAGFDNADAAKIFAPFQRLPGSEECRGFGIGLATVERIIRRHGGRVCAEGEPGKGATFYFTLPTDRD